MKDLKRYICEALISSKSRFDKKSTKITEIKRRKIRGMKQVRKMILDIFDLSEEKFIDKIEIKQNESNINFLYLCKDELSVNIEYTKNSYEHTIHIYLFPTDNYDEHVPFENNGPFYEFIFIIEWGSNKITSFDDLQNYVFDQLDKINNNDGIKDTIPNYTKYIKFLKNIFEI